MTDSLTIWSNVKFPPEIVDQLRRETAPHQFLQSPASHASNLALGAPDGLLQQADIAFGQPDPDQVMRLERIKWVQLTTAGYTRYDTPEFRDAMRRNKTIICNSSSVYADPCAQHALAMMLALARKLPHARDNQRTSHAWPTLEFRAQSVLLNNQTALLVGYGAIARRLAELLAPLHMNLMAFRRNPSANTGAVRELPISQLDDHLPLADHIVNILPASPQTDNFFNPSRFARMKQGAHYINLGRGSTNDESALQRALENGLLAAAYLDATVTEPLPLDHPLWRTPNCYITPHTAGGHSSEFSRHVELFLENFLRLRAGAELIDRIM